MYKATLTIEQITGNKVQVTIAPVGTYVLGSTQIVSNAEAAFGQVVEWIKKTSRTTRAKTRAAKRKPARARSRK